MKSIISHFHDFYDIGLKYTNNDSIVYLRNELSYKVNNNEPPLVKELYNKYSSRIKKYSYFFEDSSYKWSYKSPYRKNGVWLTIKQNKFLIVFCGKVFPALRIDIQEGDIKTITNYFYDFDSFDNYRQENGIELTEKSNINNIKKYFNRDDMVVDREFLITNKISIATIYNDKVLFNNKLSTLQFYKVYDPYVAFQELDTWLSGVLSYPQNLMIEVGNEDKIKKAGFDNKWSFRKRPAHKNIL